MKKQDFHFDLPEELIAQYPLPERSASRLLRYDRASGQTGHYQFRDLADFLQPGDLLVMNNSKVIPARVYGHKSSGGKVELLVERIRDEQHFLAHIKSSKSPKPGMRIMLDQGFELEMRERVGDLFLLHSETAILDILDKIGHIPLPPYISRSDEQSDLQRYQTIYARDPGSIAAPTAGLHFDEAVLASLESRGVERAEVTLHVGAGTFQPVRCEAISEHQMHSEWIQVSEAVCQKIQAAKARGNRVIAVGTTALRSLESAATGRHAIQPFCGDTNIFITPGYEFKIIDGLITNFHLPESTLIMLVSALLGHSQTMALYQEAIQQKYRFFSYGDACLFL